MNFNSLDLLVIFTYIGFVSLIGLYFSGNKNTKDFFLGENKLPWYFIMLSIVATETSSLTFLNIPGLSYKTDFSFLQVALGFILGRIFIAYYILPHYFKSKYISVYQWIGENLGMKTQKSISGIFLITRVLGDGVRLYATSIPITFILGAFLSNVLTEFEISLMTLFIISFSTILYTVYGGFKTVVATDTVQFLIYILGGVYSLYFIIKIVNPSSMDQLFIEGWNNGKLAFYHGFKGDFFKSSNFFINGLLGGIFISIGSHGVDQMFIQRLLACNTLNDSRKALIGSGIFVFLQFFLFLTIGFLLYNFYKDSNIPQDKVFSKFIVEQIPSPIIGLLVAAVLASAMSTLSSSINSMSLSFIVDILNRDTNSQESLKSSKLISICWGIVLFLSSIIPYSLSDKLTGGLVDLGLKISSFSFGPLIGIFILARTKYNRYFLPDELIFSIFLTILTTIAIGYYLSPALGWIIPIGLTIFAICLVSGYLLRQIFFPHKA